MPSTTPLTQPHLRVIAACAKALSSDQTFPTRVEQVFVLLRTVVSFDEVRLTYWTDFPTHEGLAHVAGGGTWGIPWDDDMVQTCIATQSPQTRDGTFELPARPGEFISRLYTSHCVPIVANGEVYGVFAYRTDANHPANSRDLATIDAIIPLFATQLVLSAATTPHSNHDERLLQAGDVRRGLCRGSRGRAGGCRGAAAVKAALQRGSQRGARRRHSATGAGARAARSQERFGEK